MIGLGLTGVCVPLQTSGPDRAIRSLFSSGEQGAWYDPSDVYLSWRRNLLTYSEDFRNTAAAGETRPWFYTRVTVTANAVTAPDGAITADKLVEDSTASSTHFIQLTNVGFPATNGITVFSLYIKAGERTKGRIADLAGNFSATFDLIAETVTPTIGTATIQNAGSGWYRLALKSASVISSAFTPLINLADASGNLTYSGDGTSGIYIWGAQLELGSTASAYQRIVTPEITYVANVQPQPILFQDAAGTIPVTGVEQPVGLVLDKSKGLVLGAELVANGDFSGGTTGWTNAASNLSVVAGQLKIAAIGTYGYAYQSFSTTIGKLYRITYTVTNGDATACYLYVDTAAGLSAANYDSGSKANGTYTAYFFATATTTYIKPFISGNGKFAYYDNISVRELPGNHAYQSTSGNRVYLAARYNLLTYTEDFSNAAWLRYGVTVATNATTAPDGAITADLITPTGLNYVGKNGLAATNATLQFSVKPNGVRYYLLYFYSGGFYDAVFDTQTLSVTRKNASISSATIVPALNGFYTLSATYTGASAGEIGIQAVDSGTSPGNSSYTGSGSYYLWGASLVPADQASLPYQRVGASTDYDTVGFPPYLQQTATTQYLVTNNIDFATNTSDGLTRRNLLTYPTAFENAVWTKNNCSVSANTAETTDPIGTNTADKSYANTTTSAGHQTFQIGLTITSGAVYTWSAYLKAAEYSWGIINAYDTGTSDRRCYFDLQNGAVGTVAAGCTATITSVGNGWYRCVVTKTTGSASGGLSVEFSNADNVDIFSAAVNSGLYLWGAQLETGSTATAFQNIGTDKMTVFAGVRKLSDAAAAILAEISTNAGSTTPGVNPGSFFLAGPSGAFSDYGFSSHGSAGASAFHLASKTSEVAPITSVVTATGSISTDLNTIRVNGVAGTNGTTDQGTGTYGTYPLYLFTRAGTTLPFTGRLYQLIVRGAESSAAQITSGETFVNSKTKAF